MFKKILAIDTSMDGCSVSLLKNNFIVNKFKLCKKKHTETILPMIAKILNTCCIKINELNAIACSKGPGNFTGIRLAICIAQAMALQKKIPLIGVSTFASMAEQAWRKYATKKVLIAFDAKKNGIYWAKYIRNNNGTWMGENTEICLKMEHVNTKINKLSGSWTTVGNGWEKINFKNTKKINLISTKIIFSHAKDIITFVNLLLKKNNILIFKNIVPIY
ncbi:tRNA (adenosine(37)-N6)-threonylcarbamoyltransferase complex dimerization subunit type 1 TsaB [Buchnera aphidicola (Pemphigus obesinymphae)]|uniref:tRNA (adenosine(37)-N6)-threonylcarbamoyltransferase complex dimerization subunit type 1 TsaB n=1 Tax=Buchnera aphidicola TaxID=9 RepID=UPI002237FCC4|nr:tRNA (adenosine(37)-N6)-threonylcarbamoyltransferase complex dimerization subunit type 1 TsaB [Buchnera aphidicola]MCW5196619.1 tRNA (adenosine(37)-N6)-threonylcarbamoyltransferase complex dimerization subunit type 1 TsaB [Buchnera aphidicola (Pemphigus obesinymphae)]